MINTNLWLDYVSVKSYIWGGLGYKAQFERYTPRPRPDPQKAELSRSDSALWNFSIPS